MEKNIALERIVKNIAVESYENNIDACIEYLMRKCAFGHEADKDEKIWNDLTTLLQNEQDALRVLGFQLLQGLPYPKDVVFSRLKQMYIPQMSKILNDLIDLGQVYRQVIDFEEDHRQKEEEYRQKLEFMMQQDEQDKCIELIQAHEEYLQTHTIYGGNTIEDGMRTFYNMVEEQMRRLLSLLLEIFDEQSVRYYVQDIFLMRVWASHNNKLN